MRLAPLTLFHAELTHVLPKGALVGEGMSSLRATLCPTRNQGPRSGLTRVDGLLALLAPRSYGWHLVTSMATSVARSAFALLVPWYNQSVPVETPITDGAMPAPKPGEVQRLIRFDRSQWDLLRQVLLDYTEHTWEWHDNPAEENEAVFVLARLMGFKEPLNLPQ